MAYVLLLQRLDQNIAASIAAGAEVDPDVERDEFNAALLAEPDEIDSEQFELMRALGIR